MIPFKNYFDLKIPVFRLSNCIMYSWQLRVTLDSCGSRDKCLYSVSMCHLNNVINKQNSCFYLNIFITNFYLKIKQKCVIERPNHNTYNYLNCIQYKTKWIKKYQIKKVKTSDFVVFDATAYHIINKYCKWCYIIIFLSNIQGYFWRSPWPRIVEREHCLIISKYVMKKLHKIKNVFKYWSVVNYLQINI